MIDNISGSATDNDDGTSFQNSEYNDFSVIAGDDDDDDVVDDEISKNLTLRTNLKKWALLYNISHLALKDLLKIFNERFGNGSSILPEDPRTLLRTPQTVNIMPLTDGEYWHHGLETCLKKLFRNLNEPVTISLTLNIDGLPIYKSSKIEFWPILFNIAEMPQVSAMVIGIFCGKAKTSDIDSFLTPFVDEINEIMANGVYVNSNKITVGIRCFVCDSPARAFVKCRLKITILNKYCIAILFILIVSFVHVYYFAGVANFNGQHGCLKCTTIGEYSYVSNTNIFPRTECERRTDEKFRQKLYGSHHKMDSPLLKLDIDMIEQFPVGDCLHLLHLGVMKRLLFGWRDGTFRNSETKWRAKTTYDVSEYLFECKMPVEFHRAVRGLDCLPHWKGTEYRTFLHYIGIVALKDHLQFETYEHFLLLFCAVTICSSKRYFRLLPLARTLLNQYIEIFKEIYGEQFNNLTHLVDEVERFGELESFSAYPFENMLGKIKRLLRNGNRPLAQVAKRVAEGVFNSDLNEKGRNPGATTISLPQSLRVTMSKRNDGSNVPEELKLSGDKMGFYSKVELNDDYCLSTDPANCWFLTNRNEIACVTNIMRDKNNVKLCCVYTQEKNNFFDIPIESGFLDIYCTNRDAHVINCITKLFTFSEIKCKLVRLKYREMNVFVPLLHTNQSPHVND